MPAVVMVAESPKRTKTAVRFQHFKTSCQWELLSACIPWTVTVSAGELWASWIGNARDCFKRLLDLCSIAASGLTSVLCSSLRTSSLVAAIRQSRGLDGSALLGGLHDVVGDDECRFVALILAPHVRSLDHIQYMMIRSGIEYLILRGIFGLGVPRH